MTDATYTLSAGQYDGSIQAVRGNYGLRFASPEAALNSLRPFLSDEPYMERLDDGQWWIWHSREDYDRDDSGTLALGTIAKTDGE